MSLLTLLLLVAFLVSSARPGLSEHHLVYSAEDDIVSIPLQRREVRRRLQTEGYRTVGFTKRESDGVYWATIRIGTPPQSFSVIVDTGSSTIAVPCKSCKDCGKHHNKFDPSLSTTVQLTGMRYSQCYSEGSCNSGEYLTDLACFGDQCQSNETVRHRFGCADNYAPAFKNQEADGIVGISGSPDTLIANLRKQYKFRKNMFALCFGRNGGSLTVGGVYHRPWREDPVYFPLASSSMFYSVRVTEVAVGNTKIAVPTLNSLPIIDSGSTFTYLPLTLHQKVTEEFNKFCSGGSHRCRGTRNPPGTPRLDIQDSIACFSPPDDVTDVDQWFLSDFPTISFWFGDKKWCIPPTTYFFLSKLENRAFCVGILRDQKFVIGAVTMADFTVIFDIDNQQVGVARSDCDGNRDVTCCSKKCPGSSFRPPILTAPPATDPDSVGPIATDSPSPIEVASLWQRNPQLFSGLFFLLGIFFALVLACCAWLCCPTEPSAGATELKALSRTAFTRISPEEEDTEAMIKQ